MNFATNLKRLRTKRKLTQREFAEIMGTSPSTITMYEIGQREPNFSLLDQMATFFNITTDELLGRNTTFQEHNHELQLLANRIKDMQHELEELSEKVNSKL